MDATEEEILGITHLDDEGLHISTEEDILLMIQAADAFVNDDLKPAPFHASTFYCHRKAILDKFHVSHLAQGEEMLPKFVLLFQKKIQQARSITHTIIFLFVITMRYFYYDARYMSKK